MRKHLKRLLRQVNAGKGGVSSRSPDHTEGYVETLGIHHASGWVANRAGSRLEISARLDNKDYTVDVAWHERADVSLHFGQRGIRPGFVAAFPYELRQALSGEVASVDRLQLLCNGHRLPHSEQIRIDRPKRARSVRQGVLVQPKEIKTGDLVGAFERIEGFTIHLKIESWNEHLQPCIVCGKEKLDCSSRFVPSKNSDGRTGTLEIELPGYVWQHAEETGKVHLQVQLGKDLVPQDPFIIERSYAVGWLNDIAYGFYGDQQYWTLLGLEHLHFLGHDALLDPESAAFLAEQAARFGLEKYLDDALSQVPSEPAVDNAASKNLKLWKALRDFNEKLPMYNGQESQLLELMLERFSEQPEQRLDLVHSLTGFFCRIGQFSSMQKHLSITQIDELASASDEWSRSLALPFIVASGDLKRASETLYSLPDTWKAWLNTECIAHATRLAIATRAKDSDSRDEEQFAYALINLLDHMASDYWSRLHDTMLLESLTCWFEDIDYCSTWLTNDLCKAVIRIYGLSPVAWSRLQEPMHSQPELLASLHIAKRRFDDLQKVLENHSSWPSLAGSAFEALTYFRQYGNKDAEAATRELSCNLLSLQNPQITVASDSLAILSGPDYLRFAVFPARGFVTLRPEHQQLVSIQAYMANISKRSPNYPLQQKARVALRSLRESLAVDEHKEVVNALNYILQLAARLRNKENLFLGLDILSDAAFNIAFAGRVDDSLIHVLCMYCLETREAMEDLDPPPAPLLNAMRKLQLANRAHPNQHQEALIEILASILKRRGEVVNASLKMQESPMLNSRPEIDNGDTLVVIYSCRKYLNSRIAAIRSTWAQDLTARGIPYLVVIGDGDDTVSGDLLALDVSDRYEHLPQKTLKLFDWVRRNTDFQYAIKIDDDCYLDVDRYFNASSHRKHHYYGRVLHRKVGEMDRTWHQNKSQGQRAQRALDKSPEPSAYADGSTGYSLSRLAMESVHKSAQSIEGKRLISSSYMEDKMLGDLLRMANIHCSDEDFYTCIRRRTFSGATTIAMWEATFLPSLLTPTKVAHLDTEIDMAAVHARKRDAEILPKRIWPTYEHPPIGYSMNQLELLCSVEKARELLQNDLLAIVVVRNEMQMLPHFLDHYRKIHVPAFVFIDNASDDGTRESLLSEPDVVLYSADTEYRNSHFGVAWQQAVLGNHCVGKWALLADADELLVYPDFENRPLQSLIKQIEQNGYDSARVFMIDMYPFGDLASADLDQQSPFAAAGYFDKKPLQPWRLGSGYYSNATNHLSAFRHRVIDSAEPNAFMSQKYALLKYQPWMRLNQGLHNAANINPMESDLSFAHFKYHAGFQRKVQVEIQRKQHFDSAKEYRDYRALLAESSGGFFEPGLSVKYEDSSSFNGIGKLD